MKVTNMIGNSGNEVKNQFIIENGKSIVFQSYNSIIVKKTKNKVYLDQNKWDCSITTGKYRNLFLGETKKETEAKIKNKTYILKELNKI